MEIKAQIMDEASMTRSIARITHEIIEKNRGCDNICLIGIKRRGLPLAARLAENIEKFEGVSVPVGYVDVSLYRDDLSEITEIPAASGCSFPEGVTGKKMILVDDVVYTGRTVRAAIEALFSKGRPASIQLAVLIDRGHRELPIKPDFVGKNVPTSHEELILVRVKDIDGENGVYLGQKNS